MRVIRYKQSTTQGRNVIISSKAPLGLLVSMVLQRIKALNLGLTDPQCRALAERFVNDANDVSGDIVLRAAKRGRNASELWESSSAGSCCGMNLASVDIKAGTSWTITPTG